MKGPKKPRPWIVLGLLVTLLYGMSTVTPAEAGKKVESGTVVNTNCGPQCGGGMLCMKHLVDGSYVTTTASPPAGRKVVLDPVLKCWRLGQ